MAKASLICGTTWHGRRGDTTNAFSYAVDFVGINPESRDPLPRLFGRNRFGLMALHDRDHGGKPGAGTGAVWLRQALKDRGLAEATAGQIELLAQPRILGHVFNPVSFFLCHDDTGALRVVVAEVTNTYGDRHAYLCQRADGGTIGPNDLIEADKLLHVSPFQPLDGRYQFTFDTEGDQIAIKIDYRAADGGGLVATLAGRRKALTNRAVLAAFLRRPLGTRRVLALIHWQAMKLWRKGVAFRKRPLPSHGDLS